MNTRRCLEAIRTNGYRKMFIEREYVVFEKTSDPNKWFAGNGQYYTGKITYVMIPKAEFLDKLPPLDRVTYKHPEITGVTECSTQDQFNKKIGRAIAKGRAEKRFAELLSYAVNDNRIAVG